MPADSDKNEKHVKTGKFLQHSDLLSYEELLRVVRLAVSLGMNKLRLTGGEPLVRKGVLDFLHELLQIPGLDEVRLTTNGVLLGDYAAKLFEEGVRHINVSLDTLNKDKFKDITGRDSFDRVWNGLQEALNLGFKIKLNVVAMKGINDDEFHDFARMALNMPIQVRFIEFMPVGEKTSWQKNQFISADEIRSSIAQLGDMVPAHRRNGDGPARMFKLMDSTGKTGSVGFISPISHHFCDKCNRLRLTSEGTLRACLLSDAETDLKTLLRNGASDLQIVASIKQTVLAKPQGHALPEDTCSGDKRPVCKGQMSRIGG